MNLYKITTILVLILLLSSSIIFCQNVVINEFMADNETTIQDVDGDFSDWIELYNNSDYPINLLNYNLSDDIEEPNKWTFPEIIISGNSFLLIFASKKNILDTNELHTNFKISSSGEDLFLSNSSGEIISQLSPISLATDKSYGHFPDGSNNFLELFNPTPNSSNNINNQLLFSNESGFYKDPFHQKITSLSGDSIFYTLNNAELPKNISDIYEDSLFMNYRYNSANYFSEIPTTPDQSLIDHKAWESPVGLIDKANILRCASYKNGIRTSKIYTKTFFVDSTIFEKYNLPIISIITEENNLFDNDSGIYVHGIHFNENNPQYSGNCFQRGDDWEKPVHIEYYEKNGILGFSQNAGIRIHGGKTRQASQKSLRLYSREEYGEKYFNYKLLPQKENNKYKRFLLRTTLGSWTHTIISDVLAHEIVRDLDIEYQDYQPVVVFINGEYWGVHTLRDRIDERYIAYLYDFDNDDIVMGADENYKALIEFIESNDLFFDDNYEYVKTQMDMSNYIDYQISEMFFANYDWPANNIEIWRNKVTESKWRWIFYDIDAGFKSYNYNYNMFNHTTVNDSSIHWPNSPESTFLFRNLLKNNDFTKTFIDRYAEILNNNFIIDTMIKKLNSIKNLYKNEIPNHLYRWHFPESFSKWENDIEDNLLFFIENRSCEIEKNIINFFNLTEFEFDFHCVDYTDIIEKDDKLIIAPNPNNGKFFIHSKFTETIKGNITISDITGRILYNEKSISLDENERVYFSINLKNNTYILNFRSDSFSVVKRLVIIN